MINSDDDKPRDDEAFFSRWSRRKQQVKREDVALNRAPVAKSAQPTVDARKGATASASQTTQPHAGTAATAPRDSTRLLTEDDFKDVDFSKLDYNSDYARFTATGVPENIRQKALTQLWHSDPIFTQVDPFQDYAGDYTDAAVVPKTALKTAYRVGQGFLTDREAHEWDRLGKPDLKPDIAALPELRPGYRVRAISIEDAEALAALQTAAILKTSAASYGDAVAASWAHGLTRSLFVERIAGGAAGYVAIDETDGTIVGMIGHKGLSIEALYVAQTHGRRGLARRLIERLLADLETTGATGTVTVGASRLSRALFERLGWRMTGTRAHVTRGGAELELFDMARPLVTDATLVIARESPDQPAVRTFFAASEAYMGALYPAESNHFVDAATLAKPEVIFMVARLNGDAVGCGAIVKDGDGDGEIKRMWVDPATRGLKLGVRVLDALEAAARADGVGVLRLETGIHQPEAIGLYRRAGYVEIGPFGSYQPDPLSLFMAKQLVAPTPAIEPSPQPGTS